MPFIVTTKRRDFRIPASEPIDYRLVSRVAVATLEEARTTVLDMDGCRWLSVCFLVIESGGTVGPLPDGTTIEVECAHIAQIKSKAGLDPKRSYPARWPFAVFNAREASR